MKEKLPDKPHSVLAEISILIDEEYGWSEIWYEVVYYDTVTKKWCSYYDSNTFENGEIVNKWVYCSDVL